MERAVFKEREFLFFIHFAVKYENVDFCSISGVYA